MFISLASQQPNLLDHYSQDEPQLKIRHLGFLSILIVVICGQLIKLGLYTMLDRLQQKLCIKCSSQTYRITSSKSLSNYVRLLTNPNICDKWKCIWNSSEFLLIPMLYPLFRSLSPSPYSLFLPSSLDNLGHEPKGWLGFGVKGFTGFSIDLWYVKASNLFMFWGRSFCSNTKVVQCDDCKV